MTSTYQALPCPHHARMPKEVCSLDAYIAHARRIPHDITGIPQHLQPPTQMADDTSLGANLLRLSCNNQTAWLQPDRVGRGGPSGMGQCIFDPARPNEFSSAGDFCVRAGHRRDNALLRVWVHPKGCDRIKLQEWVCYLTAGPHHPHTDLPEGAGPADEMLRLSCKKGTAWLDRTRFSPNVTRGDDRGINRALCVIYPTLSDQFVRTGDFAEAAGVSKKNAKDSLFVHPAEGEKIRLCTWVRLQQ